MKRKLLSFFASVALLMTLLPFGAMSVSAAVTSGTVGDCTWTLDGTRLTISGEGAMNSFYVSRETPWGKSITQVVIEDGVTVIGDYAFAYCNKLTSVSIADSVTGIGTAAFLACSRLTSVTIPDSVTRIGMEAFDSCVSLDTVELSANMTHISEQAFASCKNLSRITLPNKVTNIGKSAFWGCKSLTEMIIPNSVSYIGDNAFAYCTGLRSMTLPTGLTYLNEGVFEGCENLVAVGISNKVTVIQKEAFDSTYSLTDIYYGGSAEMWNSVEMDETVNRDLTNVTIHYNCMLDVDDDAATDALVVYSDHGGMEVQKGHDIMLGVRVREGGVLMDSANRITMKISDESILTLNEIIIDSGVQYFSFKGQSTGTTAIVFGDSLTGNTVEVRVTVYENYQTVYTLTSVPTLHIEKYPTNVYNVCGMYVDNYQYSLGDDQYATISFDVYNTNYTYGTAEVYDVDGNILHAVLIEKMQLNATSLKEAIWDNGKCLIRDFFTQKTAFTYRQESGFSKKTPVSVRVPKNGYVKISVDSASSLLVGFVNAVDILMSMASVMKDINDFNTNDFEFAKALTKKAVTDQMFIELIKSRSSLEKDFWKKIGSDVLSSKETMNSYCDTVVKNIEELNLWKIVAETAWDFGWSFGEEVVTYFMGPARVALDSVFVVGKTHNLLVQTNDLRQWSGVGAIIIQNQGGGIRACERVKVEGPMTQDTALSAFKVTLDSEVLSSIQQSQPDIWEAFSNGITHTYSISLMKQGVETQPDGQVKVYIPIPEDIKSLVYAEGLPLSADELVRKLKIFRVEEDGNVTEMGTHIEDNCFVFVTDHFSLYTIVGYDFENVSKNNTESETTEMFVAEENDGTWIAVCTLVLSVCVVGFVIFKKKRKQDVE